MTRKRIVSLTINPEVLELLREMAQAEHRSLSNLIETIAIEALQNERRTEKK